MPVKTRRRKSLRRRNSLRRNSSKRKSLRRNKPLRRRKNKSFKKKKLLGGAGDGVVTNQETTYPIYYIPNPPINVHDLVNVDFQDTSQNVVPLYPTYSGPKLPVPQVITDPGKSVLKADASEQFNFGPGKWGSSGSSDRTTMSQSHRKSPSLQKTSNPREETKKQRQWDKNDINNRATMKKEDEEWSAQNDRVGEVLGLLGRDY